MARERKGQWSGEDASASADTDGGQDRGEETDTAVGAVIDELTSAVDAVLASDLDALSDTDIKQQLRGMQVQIDRLIAHRNKCAGTLETRAAREAGQARDSRVFAPNRRFLEDELNLTPSEAKQAGQTGRCMEQAPLMAKALEKGHIRDQHARVILDTLQHLAGTARRSAERELVREARRATPTQLRRSARRLLATADAEAAERAEDRRHGRRYARMTETADGMWVLSAALSGIDAETARTAINAFRTPDATDEYRYRTPEHASADALVAALRASLDLGAAPEQHGIPAQVMVMVTAEELLSGIGTGEGVWNGPIPASEIRRLAQDAAITRVLVDARSVPLEVSEGRRNVTSGVWKALVARDRGCRWPGCDAPPAWCDAAHGSVPERAKGRLSVANGLLLCRRHHRKVDNGHWRIQIRGPDISFTSPGGRVVDSPPPV